MAHAVWSMAAGGAGAELHLRSDGSVWTPPSAGQPGTLWVADLHLGKAHQYRALGMPVGERVRNGTDTDTLGRLCAALRDTGAERLVVLGDLVHGAHTGPALSSMADRLPAEAPQVRHTVLVCGNHDRQVLGQLGPGASGHSLDGWQLVPDGQAWHQGACCGLHAPPQAPPQAPTGRSGPCADTTVCLAGHLHPCLRLKGPAREALRLPCFWLQAAGAGRAACLVLPAFGSFTGGHPVRPGRADQVWVVADGQVLPVPGLA